MSFGLSATYWRDVCRVPVLPAGEQLELARRYVATRDRRLAHRLVASNLRLVAKIARDLARSRENFEDLVQEGNAGLIHAVERFDPLRGVRLTTYASWWIRAYIIRYQTENRGVIRTGTTRAQRKEFQAGRRTPRDLSLDEPIRSDDNGGAPVTRLALLAAREEDQPDSLVEARDFQIKWRQVFGRFQEGLDERGKTIVRERWGREIPDTRRILAKRFSISGERTRQIESDLLARLRVVAQAELAA